MCTAIVNELKACLKQVTNVEIKAQTPIEALEEIQNLFTQTMLKEVPDFLPHDVAKHEDCWC